MAQTSKAKREAYNAKTYRQFGWRVRRNSELCEAIEQTLATKDVSLNHIITQQLAKFYGVPIPASCIDNQ
jgi:hypothetical protein